MTTGSGTVLPGLTGLAALGAALVAGVLLAFSAFVMPRRVGSSCRSGSGRAVLNSAPSTQSVPGCGPGVCPRCWECRSSTSSTLRASSGSANVPARQ